MPKTNCPKGHEYTDVTAYTDKNGYKHCRVCRNNRMVERRKNDVRVGRGHTNKAKTHCPKGHEYNDTNTYLNPDGRRMCRTCARANGARQVIKKYGISVEQFNEMLDVQRGMCAICSITLTKQTSMCVDHDHACCPTSQACGKCVRGILCHACNRGLGAFKDNIQYLQSAINYLSGNI